MAAATTSTSEKKVMVIGIDESDHSAYALGWTLDHFLVPAGANCPFKVVIVHAKPHPKSLVSASFPLPGTAEALPLLDADLKRKANRILERAKELCTRKSVLDVTTEVIEGDARNVLCEAAEKHHASVLVVGSHGYGPIKRAVLGSVSDYCSHHAQCSVMIVKRRSKVKQARAP